MLQPHLPHKYRDEGRNITFTVMGYRPLTEAEVLASVRSFTRVQKVKNNAQYIINSPIGRRDRIGE